MDNLSWEKYRFIRLGNYTVYFILVQEKIGRTLHDADWDEDTASEISHHILELVEEFKSL